MQNWATAQTVAVTPVDDNADTVDELALVTNVATGGGYASSAVANRTVRVTVADDDTRTGTDYDADDDQLIEIDSLAKLNAVRWDLDGDGAVAAGNATAYAAAFPGAAAGMGCPDSGDADALGNCAGYELTTDLDFDTDGDGSTWTETGGVVGGDDGDAYYDAGAGWEPIGNNAVAGDLHRAARHGAGCQREFLRRRLAARRRQRQAHGERGAQRQSGFDGCRACRPRFGVAAPQCRRQRERRARVP